MTNVHPQRTVCNLYVSLAPPRVGYDFAFVQFVGLCVSSITQKVVDEFSRIFAGVGRLHCGHDLDHVTDRGLLWDFFPLRDKAIKNC